MRLINFYLRVFFVVLWVLFTSVLYLVLSLFSRQRDSMFAKTVNFLAKGVLPILGIRLEVDGKENLVEHQPCVFIGNHQSALDVVIYGAICPANTVAIGKKEISYIPLFGWLFKYSGGILIDRKNKRKAISQIDDGVKAIKERKLSIGILPEGTRNRSGKGMLPFKKGAFHLAVESQVPLIPIVIAEFGELANFKAKNLKSGVIQIKVLDPIDTKGLDSQHVPELLMKAQSRMTDTLPTVKAISD